MGYAMIETTPEQQPLSCYSKTPAPATILKSNPDRNRELPGRCFASSEAFVAGGCPAFVR